VKPRRRKAVLFKAMAKLGVGEPACPVEMCGDWGASFSVCSASFGRLIFVGEPP
jgi:hypothetical protein